MNKRNDNEDDLVVRDQIENALEPRRDHRTDVVLRVDASRHLSVPDIRASNDEQLGPVGRLIGRIQRGAIERRRREVLADAEIQLLQDRLQASLAAHGTVNEAARREIEIAVTSYVRERLREASLREQRSVHRSIQAAARQYVNFLADIRADQLPPPAYRELLAIAQQQLASTVTAIREAVQAKG